MSQIDSSSEDLEQLYIYKHMYGLESAICDLAPTILELALSQTKMVKRVRVIIQ